MILFFWIYFHHERRERTSKGIIHLHIIQFKYYLFTLTLFPFFFLLVDLIFERETKSVYVCVTFYGYCYIDTFRLTWKNDGFFLSVSHHSLRDFKVWHTKQTLWQCSPRVVNFFYMHAYEPLFFLFEKTSLIYCECRRELISIVTSQKVIKNRDENHQRIVQQRESFVLHV